MLETDNCASGKIRKPINKCIKYKIKNCCRHNILILIISVYNDINVFIIIMIIIPFLKSRTQAR